MKIGYRYANNCKDLKFSFIFDVLSMYNLARRSEKQ